MPSEMICFELGVNFTMDHNIPGEIKSTVGDEMSS